MVDYRPFSLLIRLGVILAPILAGVLLWSYYHPPALVLSRKPAVAIPAPLPARTPNPSELAAEPADPVATPGAAAAAEMTPAVSADPAAPDAGAFRSVTPGSQTTAPQGGTAASTAATSPALAGSRQQPAPGRERAKAPTAGKQEASSIPRTLEKLDKQIDRKLSICTGC
jgi:hypothetical protein